MARKNSISYPIKPQAPETLDNNPFYGATSIKRNLEMRFGTQRS